MSYPKPFHRNYRPLIEGPNSGYSSWKYITDHEYSNNPTQYTRAFFMIQKDLKELFEYVEPADDNLPTYSHRIQQLLIRACIEIEANFKAILSENKYSKTKDLNRNDYKIINKTHHLSGYSVRFPYWNGTKNDFKPFLEWGSTGSGKLDWYDAYNDCKHDRNNAFKLANLKNLLNSIAGLQILITSQFGHYDFESGAIGLSIGDNGYYDGNFGIGEYMLVKEPTDWTDEEKYDFNWSDLCKESNRFAKIDYDKIKLESKSS
ncbi:MAG: hypothetical protein K6B17_00480 [Treponema sp.]|nr:hypothetical protein [Treponema sp.]